MRQHDICYNATHHQCQTSHQALHREDDFPGVISIQVLGNYNKMCDKIGQHINVVFKCQRKMHTVETSE